MLHLDLIKKFRKKDGTIFPDYQKYCLSNIPATIMKILGGKTDRYVIPVRHKSKKVVLLFFDGLGFDQWVSLKDDFVKKFSEAGDVYPVTTVFPSTTAAAVTTLHSGLTPQEHGLFEWYMYFKEIDMVIATLPFMPEFDPERFERLKPDPKILFRGETFYQKLKKQGIKSYILTPSSIRGGAYSDLAYRGAHIVPYYTFADMLVNLKKALQIPGKAYYYVYWNGVDTLSHFYGPESENSGFEKSVIFTALRAFLGMVDDETAKEATLIISSDHGQIEIDPKKTLYLNRFKWFEKSLKKSSGRRAIQPFGSVRDVFVHLKESEIGRVKKKIENLGTTVLVTEDAIKKGYFGLGKPSKRFLERIGDILILPDKDRTFWYRHVKGEKHDFDGVHGGLTEKEMIIPFAITNLYELKKALM